MNYEYKVIAAPEARRKRRGAGGPGDRIAASMADTLTAEANDGWEYLRTDVLPVRERGGWFSRSEEVYRAVLVFRRPRGGAARGYEPPSSRLRAPAYERPGYERTAYERPAYERPGYDRAAYDRPGFEPPVYDAPPPEPAHRAGVRPPPRQGPAQASPPGGYLDEGERTAPRQEPAVRAEPSLSSAADGDGMESDPLGPPAGNQAQSLGQSLGQASGLAPGLAPGQAPGPAQGPHRPLFPNRAPRRAEAGESEAPPAGDDWAGAPAAGDEAHPPAEPGRSARPRPSTGPYSGGEAPAAPRAPEPPAPRAPEPPANGEDTAGDSDGGSRRSSEEMADIRAALRRLER